jgi:hypothetical protein
MTTYPIFEARKTMKNRHTVYDRSDRVLIKQCDYTSTPDGEGLG